MKCASGAFRASCAEFWYQIGTKSTANKQRGPSEIMLAATTTLGMREVVEHPGQAGSGHSAAPRSRLSGLVVVDTSRERVDQPADTQPYDSRSTRPRKLPRTQSWCQPQMCAHARNSRTGHREAVSGRIRRHRVRGRRPALEIVCPRASYAVEMSYKAFFERKRELQVVGK